MHVTSGQEGYQSFYYEEGISAHELSSATMTVSIFWKANNNAVAYVVGLEGDDITSEINRALYAGTNLTLDQD